MKKTTQKEFENSITNFKKVELSLDKKESMKSKIMLSSRMQNAQDMVKERTLKSPYFSAFHFSYRMFITAFALVLFISISTAEASKYSLPGDLLYPIKTTIREPLIKLTKITPEEKSDFDLALADTRIQEMEELISIHGATEAKIKENSKLFEKHISDSGKERDGRKENKNLAKNKQKDTENEDVKVATKFEAGINSKQTENETKEDSKEKSFEIESTEDTTEVELEIEIETELGELEEDFELNSRVERYNDLMISIYDTTVQ